MMRTTWIAAATVAVVCGIARAQDNPPARPSPGGDHVFKTMDADGDGKISATEHSAGAARMFDTMDADRDGKVTAAEMTASHQGITGGKPAAAEMSAAEKIKTIDANADGVLTAEEHAAGSQAMFVRMDTDKDGSVSRAEMAAGHATKMRKHP